MIKNIKLELIIFSLLTLTVLTSYNVDLLLLNYINGVVSGSDNVYLEEFFKKITTLGDSLWYFFIFVGFSLIIILLGKTNLLGRKFYENISGLGPSCFVYLLTAGVLTQICKHLIGRARPNYTNISNGLNFDFITTNSNFHSFPSGHAATIFIISLLFGAVFPKIKYYFFVFAAIIAFSRVVVGAHYTTDVIASAVIATIVFKILNTFFEKKYTHLNIKSYKIKKIGLATYTFLIFAVIGMLVTLGPTLDLFISNFFYFGDRQFLLQSYSFVTILFRKTLIPIILIYILIVPIFSIALPIKKVFFGYVFSIRDILYIWFCLFINLIIIINVLLKTFWGRARPNDVLHFGGVDYFTPWYKISDSCLSNCSFVSGDASVGFSLLVLFFLTKKNIYCYLSIVFGSFLGIIRIAEGGHFLSDVVFSNLVIIIFTGFSYFYYQKYYEK